MKINLECNNGCRFCKISQGDYNLGKIDNPIIENEKYFAIASLGGFVSGWTLIVSRSHTCSMRTFYGDAMFVQIANETINKMRQKYNKNCIVFEHGANHEGSVTACGTNHAHLHIIPYEKSLLEEMKRENLEWTLCNIAEVSKIVGDREYWFYAENVERIENTTGYIHIITNPESQYFRKLLARKENCMEVFDYKKNGFIEIGEATYESLVR